jgi:hypothetical protein
MDHRRHVARDGCVANTSACASALAVAMAMATSSVNAASRRSVPDGTAYARSPFVCVFFAMVGQEIARQSQGIYRHKERVKHS